RIGRMGVRVALLVQHACQQLDRRAGLGIGPEFVVKPLDLLPRLQFHDERVRREVALVLDREPDKGAGLAAYLHKPTRPTSLALARLVRLLVLRRPSAGIDKAVWHFGIAFESEMLLLW